MNLRKRRRFVDLVTAEAMALVSPTGKSTGQRQFACFRLPSAFRASGERHVFVGICKEELPSFWVARPVLDHVGRLVCFAHSLPPAATYSLPPDLRPGFGRQHLEITGLGPG